MSEINLKKTIKTERFRSILFKFLVESQTVQDIVDENAYLKGGYTEYYLIRSNEFSREEFEDNVKFCNTMEHLGKLLCEDAIKTRKTITIQSVLLFANAELIFQYKFHDKKFQEWQYRVFEILTFQNLTN